MYVPSEARGLSSSWSSELSSLGAGNWAQFLARVVPSLNCWAVSPSLYFFYVPWERLKLSLGYSDPFATTLRLSSLRWKTKTEFIKELWKWVHLEYKYSCLQCRKMEVLSRQSDFLHIWCRTLSVPLGSVQCTLLQPVVGKQLTLTSLRAPENKEADTAFGLCSV